MRSTRLGSAGRYLPPVAVDLIPTHVNDLRSALAGDEQEPQHLAQRPLDICVVEAMPEKRDLRGAQRALALRLRGRLDPGRHVGLYLLFVDGEEQDGPDEGQDSVGRDREWRYSDCSTPSSEKRWIETVVVNPYQEEISVAPDPYAYSTAWFLVHLARQHSRFHREGFGLPGSVHSVPALNACALPFS